MVAQGVMLGIAQHRALEHGAGTNSLMFGAGGKLVPKVWGKAVPAAGWVSW